MRWLFLLLVVLNIFYCVWHLQGTPLRGKEVISLSLYKGAQQDIRLLSESDVARSPVLNKSTPENEAECLYVSGIFTDEVLLKIQRELGLVGLQAVEVAGESPDLAGRVLVVAPGSGVGASEMSLQELSNKFNGIKYARMRCEGLQRADSLHRIAPAPQ